MNVLLQIITRTVSHAFVRNGRSLEERYLAEAADLGELERRIRYLENGWLDPERHQIVTIA
jgi:hypothetical protein